jgi:hypothetical protein
MLPTGPSTLFGPRASELALTIKRLQRGAISGEDALATARI